MSPTTSEVRLPMLVPASRDARRAGCTCSVVEQARCRTETKPSIPALVRVEVECPLHGLFRGAQHQDAAAEPSLVEAARAEVTAMLRDELARELMAKRDVAVHTRAVMGCIAVIEQYANEKSEASRYWRRAGCDDRRQVRADESEVLRQAALMCRGLLSGDGAGE